MCDRWVGLRRRIAAAGLAVVGLVAPIATVAVLAASLVGLLLAIAAWLALLSYVVEAPRLWPATSSNLLRWWLGLGEALAIAALALGLVGAYAVAIGHDLCGGHGQAALVVAGLVYAGAAGWVWTSPRRVAWTWPLLVLLGWAVELALLFVLPGTRGHCET